MLTLTHNRTPNKKGTYPSNSPKLTAFMLSIMILFAFLVAHYVSFQVQAPSYFLLGVMLFPMSHLFNTYKAILEIRTIEGLKGDEIRRLNTTVNKRADNIIRVMLIYISTICLVAVIGVTGLIPKSSTLFICIAVIIPALIDTYIAWNTLKEIRGIEQKLLMRVNRTKARSKILEDSNNR